MTQSTYLLSPRLLQGRRAFAFVLFGFATPLTFVFVCPYHGRLSCLMGNIQGECQANSAFALTLSREGEAMQRALSRNDFIIKELVVSVGGGSRGGTWMPGPDGETPPSPISPVATVLAKIDLIETVRRVMLKAVEAGEFEDIARAFVAGDTGGNPVIRSTIHEVGAAVVAGAAYAAMGGGSVQLPDPNCGGTSLETIPTTITPVVTTGLELHRVTELPRLRRQLAETMKFVEDAAGQSRPQGEEIDVLRGHLEDALRSLKDG